MSSEVLVAVIAAGPPTLAAVLSYVASKRSLKRAIGDNPGMPLHKVLLRMESRFESRFDRVESKIDRVVEGQAATRERLARLEAKRDTHLPIGFDDDS
jgi:hypothetical protein